MLYAALRNLRGALALGIALSCCPAGAQLPSSGGFSAAPDDWLLGAGRSWHHRTGTAGNPAVLATRAPTDEERVVVEQAQRLLGLSSARALALVTGNQIVWVGYRPPAGSDKRYLSFSIGKTLTALAVGKLVCTGRITLDTRAAEHVSELSGTGLGPVTVRDLLRMSAGTWEGNPDTTVFNAAQTDAILEGRLSILDAIAARPVSAAVRASGQVFSYKSTEPLVLGLLINRVSGMPYARWLETEILLPAGIATPAIIGQDRFGFGQADGNVRMTLEDWVRVAIWTKRAETEPGCFGDFVRAATHTQIPNANRRVGKAFGGYGYLLWTENGRTQDSYWAIGHGGQRIGWNHRNNRILVAFSSIEDYMDDLYRLYAAWANLP